MFKFPEKTRKKKSKEPSETKIRLKSLGGNQMHAKTLKRNVMKMIRARQQEEYKTLFSEKEKATDRENKKEKNAAKFSNEFDKSLEYFESLAKTKSSAQSAPSMHSMSSTSKSMHNRSLKHYPTPTPLQASYVQTSPSVASFQSSHVHSLPSISSVPISLELSPEFESSSPVYIRPPPPQYGCMKNGKLPTYRTLYRSDNQRQSMPLSTINPSMNPIQKQTQTFLGKAVERMKSSQTKEKARLCNLKRKKIYRRTFRVGKSKIRPKIGVLISNKTIRQKIQQTCHEFKHADIKDIRRFLLKKGFIKIGTNAPNDVLRKMYETVKTVCGEIDNHNPDTLLFNFMNDKDAQI